MRIASPLRRICALIAAAAPLLPLLWISAAAVPVRDLKTVAGTWEGEFALPDRSKRHPVSLILRADGTYQFDTVLRRVNGKIELRQGRVRLSAYTWSPLTLTLHRERSGRVLYGDSPGQGSYRLGRVE